MHSPEKGLKAKKSGTKGRGYFIQENRQQKCYLSPGVSIVWKQTVTRKERRGDVLTVLRGRLTFGGGIKKLAKRPSALRVNSRYTRPKRQGRHNRRGFSREKAGGRRFGKDASGKPFRIRQVIAAAQRCRTDSDGDSEMYERIRRLQGAVHERKERAQRGSPKKRKKI